MFYDKIIHFLYYSYTYSFVVRNNMVKPKKLLTKWLNIVLLIYKFNQSHSMFDEQASGFTVWTGPVVSIKLIASSMKLKLF